MEAHPPVDRSKHRSDFLDNHKGVSHIGTFIEKVSSARLHAVKSSPGDAISQERYDAYCSAGANA